MNEDNITDMVVFLIKYVDKNADNEQEKIYALMQSVCCIAARAESSGHQNVYAFMKRVFEESIDWSEQLKPDLLPNGVN